MEVDRGNDWPYLDTLLNRDWRLTGYATDDAHHLTHDWLGGWVMVNATENEPDALLDALKAGHYYSSQGPEILDITHADNDEIQIKCSPATTVAISGRGARSEYVRGAEITAAAFPLRKYAGAYFRITVIDAAGAKAWSNPISLE